MRLRSAWTLVELLAVCVIVAVLAALVTSVFFVARGSARATSCIGNLQNLDKAYRLYQGDNDGRYPPYAWLAVKGVTERQDEFLQSLKPYGVDELIAFCPADGHKKSEFIGEWHSFKYSSYVLVDINLAIKSTVEPGNHVYLTPEVVKDPAATVQSLDQTWIAEDAKSGKSERFSAHGKRSNGLYVDGHIKSLPFSDP